MATPAGMMGDSERAAPLDIYGDYHALDTVLSILLTQI